MEGQADHVPYSLEWCIVLTLARYASVGSCDYVTWKPMLAPPPALPR